MADGMLAGLPTLISLTYGALWSTLIAGRSKAHTALMYIQLSCLTLRVVAVLAGDVGRCPRSWQWPAHESHRASFWGSLPFVALALSHL